MPGVTLQSLVETLADVPLPPNWQGLDLSRFAPSKTLFDYQQNALQSALRALAKYYEGTDGNSLENDAYTLKTRFWKWYQDFDPTLSLDIPLSDHSRSSRLIANLLRETYNLPPEERTLPFVHLVNRMSFWMATGSGKTLVLIKLIELLAVLMRRGEIPERDILILTHRDDLLTQIQSHVADYNRLFGLPERPFIRLHDLKEYTTIKRSANTLFKDQETTVFYYRSDNLSDVQKERIVDFRNYENGGNWYVFLDEAHKGDKEDSKRQHIFSILSRNGFLFNFSATFTDPRDLVTTVVNYNLSEFIRNGHGKHIAILRKDVRQFRKNEDYSDEEKQKIILQALLLLAHARQMKKKIDNIHSDLYHRPLLMTLVNSVNTEESDLKLFFRQLAKIANGKVDPNLLEDAKAELLNELENDSYLFEEEKIKINRDDFYSLTLEDLYRLVFNASTAGEIEILVRRTNRQEIALKIKTAAEPFALIRIGDITNWLRNELVGFAVSERFEDEGYFERLNQPDSTVNILLGSRSFYEGWDSNRPNVVMFINIGMGSDARKFILQSIGRGVRIEPLRGQRKRLRFLHASTPVMTGAFHDQIRFLVNPLESVFVLGTNRSVLQTIFETLDEQRKAIRGKQISLLYNEVAVDDHLLLIPVYRDSQEPICRKRDQVKFPLSTDELERLKAYLTYLSDDRLLVVRTHAAPWQISLLRQSVQAPEKYFRTDGNTHREVDFLSRQVLRYYDLQAKEVDRLKILENEICHYQQIRVFLEDIRELQDDIRQVAEYSNALKQAKEKVLRQEINIDEYTSIVQHTPREKTFTFPDKSSLDIRFVEQHYYIPVLLTRDERIDYIRNVIHHPSEVDFILALEKSLENASSEWGSLQWWMFSRLDEQIDAIRIPYYNPDENRMADFCPDFVFWMQKDHYYHIVFVDPKGAAHTSYEHKADGFSALFEQGGQAKTFTYNNLQVQIHLKFYTKDVNRIAEKYRRFWLDNPLKVIPRI